MWVRSTPRPPRPQTIECPRWHAPNHPSQHYCSNCGALLYGYQQSTVVEELRIELNEIKEMLSSYKDAFKGAKE
jgi:hypothetical protein